MYALFLGHLGAPLVGAELDSAAMLDAWTNLPGWAQLSAKALVAGPAAYHTLNGFRHLGWDAGYCASGRSPASRRRRARGSRPRLPSLLLPPSRTRTDTSRTPRPQSSSSSRPTWPATPSSAPRPSRPRPSSRSERLDPPRHPRPRPRPVPLVVPPFPSILPPVSTAVPPEETSDPRCAARACNACTSSPSSRSSARVSVRDLDRPARAPVFDRLECESSWTGEAIRERAVERPACATSATSESEPRSRLVAPLPPNKPAPPSPSSLAQPTALPRHRASMATISITVQMRCVPSLPLSSSLKRR